LLLWFLLNNDYPLKMIFNHINKRIKNLVNKSNLAIKTNNSNIENEDETIKNMIIFPYVRSIMNKITNIIDKSKTMIGYRQIRQIYKDTQR